jgi:hypothetical protein
MPVPQVDIESYIIGTWKPEERAGAVSQLDWDAQALCFALLCFEAP